MGDYVGEYYMGSTACRIQGSGFELKIDMCVYLDTGITQGVTEFLNDSRSYPNPPM